MISVCVIRNTKLFVQLFTGITSMADFPDSIYLDPYCSLTPHLFHSTPVIKDKKVEIFHYLNCINSLSSHLVSIYQSYTINDILLNIYAKVFGREIQPHEMVTQSPAMIFNQ